MTETDYEKILESLESASRVFAANQGDLCDADLRARSSVSHAITEIQRSLVSSKQSPANGASRDPGLHRFAEELDMEGRHRGEYPKRKRREAARDGAADFDPPSDAKKFREKSATT